MEIIQALILSIIEGITEFLPVSSTGHLLLATNFLKIPQTEFVKSFEVIIQLGAILAVVVLYWKQLSHNFAIYRNIVIAFIPSAIVGLVLYDFIKEVLFENILITVGALLIGGVLLIIIERLHKEQSNNETIEQSSLNNKIIKLLPEKKIQVEGKNVMKLQDFANGYSEAQEILQRLLLS